MANVYDNPIVLDTDITSYRTAAASAGIISNGGKVEKLMLVVGSGGAATAGTVTIKSPSSKGNFELYPPILVGTQPANTTILNDNISRQVMTWADFAVTGLTASGTKLYIWLVQ